MLKPGEDFKLPEVEKKVLEYWKGQDIFKKSLAKRKKGKTFVFYEGPPTANGRPGIHHILARAFKDIILRYKTMRGFYVPRRAGWDTHGLPVEVGVEKELGIKNKRDLEKFGIDLFNQKAKESVWRYKDEWERLTERMGYWLDMERPYVTYDNDYIETLWWIFSKIAERGYLKEDRKIVPYCPRCQTSLASHELGQPGVYKKVPDPSVYIKFKLEKPFEKGAAEYILVWTTTPWTLPANMFIAADPKLTYTKYKIGKEYYWSYSAPPTPNKQNEPAPELEVVGKISGQKLLGLRYEPVFDVAYANKSQIYEILPADFISTEDGTGFVHIAPAFGEDDFRLVKNLYPDLEIIVDIDSEGRVNEPLPGAGKFIKEADLDLAKDLVARNLMYHWGKIEHEYPFCWRCGTPLIYFARVAWFFAVSKLRKQLLEKNKKINWIPGHLKEGRFGEWLKDAKDWAISRERYWGTPLPIWKCQDCEKLKVVGGYEELRKNDYQKNHFYLVRHTEADHIVSGVIASGKEGGERVSHLTKKGIKEAGKTALKLKKEKIGVIYSSPMTRARELAKIISEATGAKIIIDERLTELNAGSFNWKPVKEYRKFFAKPSERWDSAPLGGETLADVKRRVFSFAEEINSNHKEERIAIVGHGDPLWILESTLAMRSKEEALKYPYIKLGEARKIDFPNLPLNDLGELDAHRPYADRVRLLCSCGGKMTRVKEVADVWFDSGAMPLAEDHFPFAQAKGGKGSASSLIKKINYPADYISEAVDQTRGWFYTLLATSTLLGFDAPYRNVISLGLIHDKFGLKMSKSKGNIVDPWEMMEKYGVDAVRWYFYTVNPPGEPKNFDESEILKSYRKFHMLVYNSFVFFRTYGKKPSAKAKLSKNALDRWILSRLAEAETIVTGNLEKYDVREAALALEEFADDLSRWYIRRSRRRLQKPESQTDYAAASDTLYYTLLALTRMTAPFMPFLSDALYLELLSFAGKKKESVHLADWPKAPKKPDAKLLSAMKEARLLASLGLAARAEAGIKVRQPLQALFADPKALSLVKDKEVAAILLDEVNVKTLESKKDLGDKVELDRNITPELKEEGSVRELARAVQELRQGADLSPKDKIALFMELPAELANVAKKNEGLIKREVGAKTLDLKRTDKFNSEISTKLDGADIWLAIRKI